MAAALISDERRFSLSRQALGTLSPQLISSTVLWDRVPRDVPFMTGLTANGPDEARSSNGIFSSRTALTSQLLEVSLSFQEWLCSCQRDGRASLQS